MFVCFRLCQEKYDLTLDSHFDGIMGRYTKKSWKRFVTDENRSLVSDEALDLLDQLLQYDHQKRPTCKEAMMHPYFDTIRAQERAKNGLPPETQQAAASSSSSAAAPAADDDTTKDAQMDK